MTTSIPELNAAQLAAEVEEAAIEPTIRGYRRFVLKSLLMLHHDLRRIADALEAREEKRNEYRY
jgi:hypothetical protein